MKHNTLHKAPLYFCAPMHCVRHAAAPRKQTALFWLGCVHSGTGGPWPALAAEGPRFGPRLAGPQRGCGRQGIGEGGGSHGGGHRPHIVYTWVEMGVPCGGGGGTLRITSIDVSSNASASSSRTPLCPTTISVLQWGGGSVIGHRGVVGHRASMRIMQTHMFPLRPSISNKL